MKKYFIFLMICLHVLTFSMPSYAIDMRDVNQDLKIEGGLTVADNVGIGNTAPAEKLDVTGKIRTGRNGTDGELQIYSEQGSTDYTLSFLPNASMTQDINLTFPVDDGDNGQAIVSDGDGNLFFGNPTAYSPNSLEDEDGDTKVQVEESADEDKIRFDTAGNQRMIVDETGNVGIGKEPSSYMLEVQGSIDTQAKVFCNTLRVNEYNQTGNYNAIIREDDAGNIGPQLQFRNDSNTEGTGARIFFTNGDDFSPAAMEFNTTEATAQGEIVFKTGDGPIDDNDNIFALLYDGRVAMGDIGAVNSIPGYNGLFNIISTGSDSGTGISMRSFSNSSLDQPNILFYKSRSDTRNTLDETLNGDLLGNFKWHGVESDDDFNEVALIEIIQDGNSTTSGVPADIRIRTAGSNGLYADEYQLVIDPTGNVGIGIEDPLYKLHVDGDIKCDNIFTDSITSVSLRDADGDTQVQVEESADEDKIRFDTLGTERMIITDTGNVGIGPDVNPDALLHVYGTVRSGDDGTDGRFEMFSEQGGTDYTVAFAPDEAMTQDLTITLPANDGTPAQALLTDGTGDTYWGDVAGSVVSSLEDADGDTKIQVEESADEDKIRFDTFGLERMIIDELGGIGIGTSTPDSANYILDVLGAVNVSSSVHIGETTPTSFYELILREDNSGGVGPILQLRNDSNTEGTGSRVIFTNGDDQIAASMDFNTTEATAQGEIIFKVGDGPIDDDDNIMAMLYDGRIAVGNIGAVNSIPVYNATFNIIGTGSDPGNGMSIRAFSNSTIDQPNILFYKSRGTTRNVADTTLNGDTLGNLKWHGVDSDDEYEEAAEIVIVQDGVADSNSVYSDIILRAGKNGTWPDEYQVVVDRSGNVGIGIEDPLAKLHVDGDIICDNLTASNVIITKALKDNDEDTQIQVEESPDEDKIRFDTAGTERMIITDTGEVGVGDNITPETKFHVDGAIRSGKNGTDGRLEIFSEQGATDYILYLEANVTMSDDLTLTFPTDNGTPAQALLTDGSGNLYWDSVAGSTVDKIIDADGDTKIQVEESADEDKIRFDTFGVERMIIDDGGLVGIGTDIPSQELDVIGDIVASISVNSRRSAGNPVTQAICYSDSTSNFGQLNIYKSHTDTLDTFVETIDAETLGEVRFYGADSGNNVEYGSRISVVQNGTAGVRVPADMYFYTYSDTTVNNNHLVLHHDNTVGIGLNTPEEKLTIKGNGVSASTASLNVTDSTDVSLFYVQDNGKVGIGTEDPDGDLDVVDVASKSQVYIKTYSTNEAHDANLIFHRSRDNTGQTKVETIDGDDLGEMWMMGITSNSTSGFGARIKVEQDGASGSGNVPCTMSLSTSKTGSENINQLLLNSDSSISFNDEYTFPISDGTDGQVLTTDGLGQIAFEDMIATSAGSVVDADGDTKIQVEESADEDKIRFDTFGLERMIIDENGNVGIATETPGNKLQVDGTVYAKNGVFIAKRSATNTGNSIHSFSETDSNRGILLFYKSSSATIDTYSTTSDGESLGTLQFYGVDSGNGADWGAKMEVVQDGTAGVRVPTTIRFETYKDSGSEFNHLVLKTGGNVGIGLGSPGERLTVKGSGASSSTASLNVTDSTDSSLLYVRDDGHVGIGETSPPGKLTVSEGNTILRRSATDTRVTVDTYSTNVSHEPALQIRKSHSNTLGTNTATINNETLGLLGFSGVDSGSTSRTSARIIVTQDGTVGSDYVPSEMVLEASGTSGLNTNQLVLASDANVGIGTLTPSQLLDVQGAIGMLERSSDPAEPAEGNCVMWMSDGTEKGDDGDVMIASQAGGTTKYGTLFDHSTGTNW